MKKSEIIKLIAAILLFALFISTVSVFSEGFEGFNLIIDNTYVNKEVKAVVLEGLTYIPLSKVSGMLDIKIEQNPESILLSRNGLRLMLKVQQGKAYLEEDELHTGGFVFLKDNIIFVPVLFLKDHLGLDVEVLYDIKFIRIKRKADGLLAGEISERQLNPDGIVKHPLAVGNNNYSGSKVAYLTFDDGLDNKVTPQILDILKQYKLKATFFIIGNTIGRHKDVLKRIIDEGHNIGNHTYTHKKEIIYTSVKSFSEELAKTSKAMYDVIGITPKLFRPPYGAPYIRSTEYQEALSQYKIVLWNVDSMDSRVKGIIGSEIAAAVKNQVRNKSNVIILFHNTSMREETVKALPEVIEFLIDNGYSIEKYE